MSNPYYIRSFTAVPLNAIKSAPQNDEFERVEDGFDAVSVAIAALDSEVLAARQNQPSLLVNLLRYVNGVSGLTQALQLNGYRVTGAVSPLSNDELASKGYVDAQAFSPALPGQAGQAGKEVTTDGTNATWGLTGPGALAILNFLGY